MSESENKAADSAVPVPSAYEPDPNPAAAVDEAKTSLSVAPPMPKTIPPVPTSPVREFADHIDRERQMFKDWVRQELHLAAHGMSHEDRVKENP
jgi:hypothetical protein